MRIPPLLAPLALAAILSVSASAQRTAPPPQSPERPGQPLATIVVEPAAMAIAACDSDFDGGVTRDELHACLLRTFLSVSEGKPTIGYIGYGDWARRWLGDQNALPSPYTIDADNDDRITPLELQTQFDRYFDRFDVDHDGSVSRAELLTIRTGTPPPGAGRSGKPGKGKGC